MQVIVDEHVMALDVPMHDSQIVHVQVDAGAVETDLNARFQRDFHGSFHVQQGEQTVVNELIHNDNVWDRGTASHEQSDIWVPQNALHHNFILYFQEELIRDARVKNFLDGYWSAIEEAFMDDREPTLADLFSYLDITH